MLNYILKENCISADSTQPIVDYLISLGIKENDVDSFINKPRESDELSPWLLNNMQNAVYLFYYEEMSYKQIANVLKKSSKQIDNILFRAKKILKEKLLKEVDILE